MLSSRIQKVTATSSTIAALVLAALLFQGTNAQAQTPALDPAKVLKGLQIAPVPLNMVGKDPSLIGYGSYLVNAVADCNGCHSAGPTTEYVSGGMPYFGQHPAVVNPATYLGGGRDFGAFPDPNGPFPHIVSRNLTPDSTGLPEGGNTFQVFLQIIRTGIDMDHVHPTCAGPPDGKCIPAPFSGDLLQVMPWPVDQNMSDSDLQAIYEYLRAIPCLEGGPGEPPNRCVVTGPKTVAIAGPKNASVSGNQIQLDGSMSTSADGNPLTYLWTVPQGSPGASIQGAATARPTVQLSQNYGTYTFQLTVTDSTGKSATDLATVNYY